MQDGFPEASARAMILRQEQSGEYLQGVWTSEGRLIGVVGHVVQSETDVEIGYWFALAEQGKGYAREAMGGLIEQICAHPVLGRRRIIAEAHPRNAASIALLGKVGFVPTGQPGHRPQRIGFELPR